MNQLIANHYRSAERIVAAEARRWYLPECNHEDILQDVLARTFQYWKPGKARDLDAFFLSTVRLNAKTVVMRLKGFHNGNKRAQAVKARGEDYTQSVGLYQPLTEGDDLILDERILPTVASAEDVYLATVPTKRQTALRRAIQSLPERQRTALTHQFYEELSVAESASLMGVSVRDVYNLRSNGMRRLKELLNG